MRVDSVQIYEELRPLASQSLRFPKSDAQVAEVHLFTGPNGTGKSRFLAAMAGIGIPPNKTLNDSKFGQELKLMTFSEAAHLVHTDNPKIDLLKPRVSPSLPNEAVFAFKGSSILTPENLDIFSEVGIPSIEERLSFAPWKRSKTNQRIVEFKIQAAMEAISATDDPSRRIEPIIRIEKAISEITGRDFAVITQKRPNLQLMFKWGESRLSIEHLPDGLSSILSWVMDAATSMDLIYPDSSDPLGEPAIFFLDEPETHLHPQWQRRILPMAQEIFTGSQFFVATHSPFIVSSLNDGYIYQLRRCRDGLVKIDGPYEASKGDSYISAAERFLETGEWFDPESESLLHDFREFRTKALDGDLKAYTNAVSLAQKLSGRSQELANMIGPELAQLERSLTAAK